MIPITLIVNLGSKSSSKEYNKYKEGTKIEIIIDVGNNAQINSKDKLCLKSIDSNKVSNKIL